jgi:lipopolysaccharide transport system ATP-binding protein
MSSNPAIRVRKLSKCYEIYAQPQDRLKQSICPRLQRLIGRPPKTYYREFWALRDVSFEVNEGEAVGIVGRNGAGKSTLLQMICGTLTPTVGAVEIQGTVAALLELGSGFNPEFTGRENVYLSASMLGLGQKEIDEKFDEIADFADIGDFLEQPTKTYSSGMLMRLAFAVNTCINPEILIVDEALSVGDAPFQSKCFKRLRKLLDDGTSVLFVSHDISTVSSICSRALWLTNGRIEMWGEAKEVVKQYERFCWQAQGVLLDREDDDTIIHRLDQRESETAHYQQVDGSLATVPDFLLKPNPEFAKSRAHSSMGTGVVKIKNFVITNDVGVPISRCVFDEQIEFYYLIEAENEVNSEFMVGIRFKDIKGNYVYSANNYSSFPRIEAIRGQKFLLKTSLRVPLHHQSYAITTSVLGFQDGIAALNYKYDFARAIVWDFIDEAAFITVSEFVKMPLAGPVHTDLNITIQVAAFGSISRAIPTHGNVPF